jgi:hypothetical protein
MTLEEIKEAVRGGKRVCWSNRAYDVILYVFPSGEEQWLIKCNLNGHCIGLTWMDGVTMNGEEEQFFIRE